MSIIAIDPGSEQSAFVIYDKGKIIEFGKYKNKDMLFIVGARKVESHLAIEMVACYGMPVGKTIFDTCVWIGRFIEAWGRDYTQIYRKEVTLCLCNSVRAKDPNVRQAIIDRYPSTGGGKIPQIGIKAKPGPLYGISEDVWAALGVAICFSEIKELS